MKLYYENGIKILNSQNNRKNFRARNEFINCMKLGQNFIEEKKSSSGSGSGNGSLDEDEKNNGSGDGSDSGSRNGSEDKESSKDNQ